MQTNCMVHCMIISDVSALYVKYVRRKIRKNEQYGCQKYNCMTICETGKIRGLERIFTLRNNQSRAIKDPCVSASSVRGGRSRPSSIAPTFTTELLQRCKKCIQKSFLAYWT